MKRRYAAILGIGIVLAGMFTAQSASAAGSWQPYPGGFSTPSNWHCGPTKDGPRLSAQACVVRSGNYVQAATIVRNRSSVEVFTGVYVQQLKSGSTVLNGGQCRASGVAANSVSVCFTSTTTSSGFVTSNATVSDNLNGSFTVYSVAG